MSKWHSLLEYVQFPLKVLFFASVLLGIGSIVSHPELGFITIDNQIWVFPVSNVLKYSGGFLISLFPLLVFLKLLTKKFEDSAPVFVGFFSYIIITVIVAVLVKSDLPIYFYKNILGISIQLQGDGQTLGMILSPYNLGVFSLIAAYFITMYSYKRSRHIIRDGFLYFIDHDTWAMIITFIGSIIAGLLFAFLWPYVINMIEMIANYIASDINNPLHLFVYGIFERVCAIFDLIDIPRNIFWYSEAGGSLIDSSGVTYLGDIGMWRALVNNTEISSKAGQFISAYYIINIFIMPAFLLAYYKLLGTKDYRKKYLIFILIAIASSVICGNPLPFEICMLILSPLLYVFYIVLVGICFAATTSLGALVGYTFTGAVLVGIPGSIIDLIIYLKSSLYIEQIMQLVSLGLGFGVMFYLATIYYFKKLAIGFISVHDVDKIAYEVLDALGGEKNITYLEATPDKIIARFENRDIVDLGRLKKLGAYLILESKDGYCIRLGNISIMVTTKINEYINNNAQEKI